MLYYKGISIVLEEGLISFEDSNKSYVQEIDDLVKSINEVGLLQSLVINQHNQVISGNRRFTAIKKLDWTEVEVEQIDIDDEDVGKYLVHYNKFRVKKFREVLNEFEVLRQFYKRQIGRPHNKEVSPKLPLQTYREFASAELDISESTIARLLVIQKEDDDLIDAIDKEILTVRQAYFQVTRLKKERESRSNKSENQVENTSVFSFHQRSSDNMIELSDSDVKLCFTSPPYWNKRKYEDRWIMNIADDLIKFDTTIRGRLGADYFKSTVKSMSYECVVSEWE